MITRVVLRSVIACIAAAVSIDAFAPPSCLGSSVHTKSLLYASPKVFIDGEAGTTGLQVRERLEAREDIEILKIPDDLRKDDATRKRLINEADAVILCLPDAASEEAASWVDADNDRTVLIDASTAFRVDDAWDYGMFGESWVGLNFDGAAC
jgi:hypothetical protein